MAELKSVLVNENVNITSGTFAERPANPQVGMIRFNTEAGDSGVLEYYNNSNEWVNAFTGTPSGYFFEDDFSSNTLSNYTQSGGGSFSYDSTNDWVFVNLADNITRYLTFTAPSNAFFPNSGTFEMIFQKTNDYPGDNSQSMYIKQSSDTFYEFGVSGSNYGGAEVKKFVNDNLVDQKIGKYDFDDETSFHKFQLVYSPNFLEGRVNGVPVVRMNTSNSNVLNANVFEVRFAQVDGRLRKLAVQDLV